MIAGIADNSLSKPVEELRDILSVNDDTLPYILLAHEPQYYDKYTDLGADIVLTGHVHGGQFIIPGKGGFISPEFQIFPELYSGEHIYKRDGGETAMIISRGLGNSGIPLRINNSPEIVVALTVIIYASIYVTESQNECTAGKKQRGNRGLCPYCKIFTQAYKLPSRKMNVQQTKNNEVTAGFARPAKVFDNLRIMWYNQYDYPIIRR